MQAFTCCVAFPAMRHSLGGVVPYHRVSHQNHLGSRQLRHKVSPQAGRWWSRWHTHGERAYTPVPHSCPHLSCPHNRCRHHKPRLCWCSVLQTEGRVISRATSVRTLHKMSLKAEWNWSVHFKKCGFLTGVPAAKLDSWITHVRDTLTVLLIAHVHAVSVSITAPAQGDAQAIHPTLKLICMTTSRRASGWKKQNKPKNKTSKRHHSKVTPFCDISRIRTRSLEQKQCATSKDWELKLMRCPLEISTQKDRFDRKALSVNSEGHCFLHISRQNIFDLFRCF